MTRVCVLVLLAAVLAAGSACSFFRPSIEAPRIGLTAFEPLEMRFLEQRYRLTLRIQNPNDFALRIKGFDYTVTLNGEAFGHGVSNQPVTVPAYGESLATVEMTSSLGRLLEQIRSLAESRADRIRYAIAGKTKIAGFAFRIPFERSGEVQLPR